MDIYKHIYIHINIYLHRDTWLLQNNDKSELGWTIVPNRTKSRSR